jgi:hypothetical protein
VILTNGTTGVYTLPPLATLTANGAAAAELKGLQIIVKNMRAGAGAESTVLAGAGTSFAAGGSGVIAPGATKTFVFNGVSAWYG